MHITRVNFESSYGTQQHEIRHEISHSVCWLTQKPSKRQTSSGNDEFI